MRILGTNAATQAAPAVGARRAAASGFSLDRAETPQMASGSTPLRTVGGIDALLALQGADDPTERRKRAVRRGGLALDVLDDLKVALLSGDLGPSLLQRLKAIAADRDPVSGDQGLDSILGQIDLRVAVEIAKMTRA
jgi:hypothetical protein